MGEYSAQGQRDDTGEGHVTASLSCPVAGWQGGDGILVLTGATEINPPSPKTPPAIPLPLTTHPSRSLCHACCAFCCL